MRNHRRLVIILDVPRNARTSMTNVVRDYFVQAGFILRKVEVEPGEAIIHIVVDDGRLRPSLV